MNVRKRKRLLPDCPGTKKETLFFFHFLPGLKGKKKITTKAKSAEERGGVGEITGHSAKK